MENHPAAAVAEDCVKVINRLTARALHLEVRIDRFRCTEQLQRLVTQVRAEIEPNAAARSRLFPPALARFGAVTVVVRFEVRDLAERAIGKHFAQSEKIRIPAPILKDGEQSPASLRKVLAD